jgi:hypothetical protein
MYNVRARKVFAWCGFAALNLFFIGLIVSGFFPPLSPSLTEAEVVARYQENHFNILIGMNIVMIGGVLVFPFVGLTTELLLKIKGAEAFAYTQLAAGAVSVFFVNMPGVFFLIAAYRTDTPAEILYFMNDFAWIMTVLPWPFQVVVNVAIALAILSDKSETPVFPRWFGYCGLWIALLFTPASLLVFFDRGPFAWSGLFPFYLVGVMFAVYWITLAVLMVKAINREALEAA